MGQSIYTYNIIITLILVSSISCTVPPVINTDILKQSKSIGECKSCKLFIESFHKGLARTSRGKFEGGDAAWEEEKLKSYKWSEMRLIDIQEGICKDVSKYLVQCHHMAERAEEFIEEWWFKAVDDAESLFENICINKLKVCCPPHHYGKNCSPCPGDHSNLCSGNGHCLGDGTRKGNGTCLCEKGYSGEVCNECALGYWMDLSNKDSNKILCSKCHESCLGGCHQGSQRDCVACKPGFILDTKGCIDIDECNNTKKCNKSQYCLNTIGSYKCVNCDKSCSGCYGDGSDMCQKCAVGYIKEGDFCLPEEKPDIEADVLTAARYRSYIALLIATLIMLPKLTYFGTIMGIAVVTYIFGAEYYCMINGHQGLVNMKDYDLSRLFII